jgi:hypothetical protein
MGNKTVGVVFRGEIQSYKLGKIKKVQSDSFELPFEKTLFVEGVRIPVDLLPAAWHFLERWDAAAPLWRYGATAEDIGTPAERERTQEIVRDLRVLLYSYELLFVRRNAAGQALMAAWEEECSPPSPPEGGVDPSTGSGCDKRLAFLRAFYRVKPRLCVLPRSWLAEVKGNRSRLDMRSQVRVRGSVRPTSPNAGRPLVAVEVEPGRFVKVHKGDEERVLAQFEQMRGGRRRGGNQ